MSRDEENSKRDIDLEEFPRVEDVMHAITCAICLEVPKPPVKIFTCTIGHIVCGNCRYKTKPSFCHCKSRFSNKRCLFAENIMASSLFACDYKKEGCSEKLIGKSLEEHRKVCKYRPYTCNLNFHKACRNTSVHIKQFLDHLKHEHFVEGSMKKMEEGNTFHLSINTHCKNVLLISYMVHGDKEFLIQSFIINEELYAWITLLDPSDLHKNYQFDVKFDSEDSNRRKTYNIPVYPTGTDFHSVLKTFGYIKMTTEEIKTYSKPEMDTKCHMDIRKLHFSCTIVMKNKAEPFE